ncbi:MAG: site-2 protease family protein [Candidatus Odinarchaeum yellowstonii]|uniref:Site-2 protease family protein n=1 Tax=Odinarchaeota yellowstonii (strain LCB_4) TaxID=1841599 RepID=A0AAF0D2C0_ODILC|nr:MAG: site-2 protease family protein [Candidatus Odinarchaeum yellowstonii]
MNGLIAGDVLEDIDEKIRGLFNVRVSFKESGSVYPTYIIGLNLNVKASFNELRLFLKKYGLTPRLVADSRNSFNVGEAFLKISSLTPVKNHPVSINVILFLVTLATTASTGFYICLSGPFLEVYPESNIFLVSFGFTLSVIGITGLHELGHVLSLKKTGCESSLPYFIPGIPILGLPTFGAVILQRTPPANRDTLFDLGLSGPLTSFILSFIVITVGSLMSKMISPAYAEYLVEKYPGVSPLPVPILFLLIQSLIFPSSTGVVFIHPIAYAGWLGLLITALNLFPIGQLDGGHSARAVLGERFSRYASYISLILLIGLGYWLMALLVFLISGLKNQGPLDDVSPISKIRIILWGLSILLLVLSVTPLLIF